MKKFKLVDGNESSIVYERKFSGKMTKKRYKFLDSWTRRKSYREHCGCEWDCCGCLFAVSYNFRYKFNQVTITMVESRNY
jgi:hypothetical protein